MFNHKTIQIILGVLIFIGVLLLLTQRYWVSPLVNQILEWESIPSTGATIPIRSYTRGDFVWHIRDATKTLSATEQYPLQNVSLSFKQKEYSIGEYVACNEDDTDLLPNEITKLTCWWAGVGKNIGIFQEEDGYVVKVLETSEVPLSDEPYPDRKYELLLKLD